MPRFRRSWLFAGAAVIVFALLVVVFVRDSQTPPPPVAQPLTQTFNESVGFSLMYPDDWGYTIPAVGVFIVEPDQTLDGSEAGPSLTVQRAEPISEVVTLDGAVKRYLDNGPLLHPGLWRVTNTAHTIQFDGRDARELELEGSDTGSPPILHTQLILTSSVNTFVYLIVTTVPVEKQATFAPTLNAMLASIKILE